MNAELPSRITVSEGNTWTPCSIPKGVLVSSAWLSSGDICPACTWFPIPWAVLNQPLQSSNTAGEFCWPPSREGSIQVASNKLQFNMLNYITLCTYFLFFVEFSRHMLQLPLLLTSGACFHTKQAHVVSSHVLAWLSVAAIPTLATAPPLSAQLDTKVEIWDKSNFSKQPDPRKIPICMFKKEKSSTGVLSAQKNIKLNYN